MNCDFMNFVEKAKLYHGDIYEWKKFMYSREKINLNGLTRKEGISSYIAEVALYKSLYEYTGDVLISSDTKEHISCLVKNMLFKLAITNFEYDRHLGFVFRDLNKKLVIKSTEDLSRIVGRRFGTVFVDSTSNRNSIKENIGFGDLLSFGSQTTQIFKGN